MRKITILLTALLVASLMFTFNTMNVESQDVQPETMIKGTVNDAVTEEPIHEAIVRLFTGTQNYIQKTDENGGYEFALQVVYMEDFELFVSKPGYYDQWESGEIERGEILIIDFHLEPIPCRVYGRVLDMDTNEPIQNVYVYLYSPISGEQWETWSDMDGYYEIYAEPGSYFQGALATGYLVFESEDFDLDEGQEIEINISLEPIRTGVIGMVTNDGGGAIPDAYVLIYSDRFFDTEFTDEEGKYEIRAPPGEYTIEVSAEGYLNYEDTIEVPEDEMLEYDVVMEDITVTGVLRLIVDYILEVIGGIF